MNNDIREDIPVSCIKRQNKSTHVEDDRTFRKNTWKKYKIRFELTLKRKKRDTRKPSKCWTEVQNVLKAYILKEG